MLVCLSKGLSDKVEMLASLSKALSDKLEMLANLSKALSDKVEMLANLSKALYNKLEMLANMSKACFWTISGLWCKTAARLQNAENCADFGMYFTLKAAATSNIFSNCGGAPPF